MPGYKIKRNNKKFYFVLFPTNSNTQELGKSIEYDSESECVDAIEQFRRIVKINKIDSINSDYVVYDKCSNIKIMNENKRIIFITRNTYLNRTKRASSNTINSIYRNIDAEIK